MTTEKSPWDGVMPYLGEEAEEHRSDWRPEMPAGFRPLKDRVLILEDQSQGAVELSSGIVAWKKEPDKIVVGTVLAVGPRVKDGGIRPGVRMFWPRQYGEQFDNRKVVVSEEYLSFLEEKQ